MTNTATPPPGLEQEPCPGLPDDFNLEKYTSTPMTNWFAPGVFLATGIRDLLSKLFAAYADRRATIAALSKAEPYSGLGKKKEVWVDYVADSGDGWDSTYSVAWCLAQLKQIINVKGNDQELKRGDVLVMGGDQVYPYASAADYKRKMVRPYQAALPCSPGNKHPLVFAIPGNHDWYDGLRGFLRHFCQGHWLGGWKTAQTRPYWAVNLPHGWWLLGIDSQMDDYIDQAQLDFFDSVGISEGDRVILCVSAPSWIFAATGDKKLHRNLAFFENRIIANAGARLVLTLSGDLHHYAHYATANPEKHKITCGGGGAFTHGTHHLPEEIHLCEADNNQVYRLNETKVPDRAQSGKLLLKNLLFPFRHKVFAMVLGGFYLAYALVLATAGLPEALSTLPLQIDNIFQAAGLFIVTTFSHIWPFVFFILLIASGYGFSQPNWHSNPDTKRTRKLAGGTVHAFLHLVLLVLLVWVLSHRPDINLPPFAPDWASAARFSLAILLGGGIAGGVLFGIYLSTSNFFFGFHRTEAFSAVRDEHHKSFLRMHIDQGGLTVYPLGLQSIERNWETDPEGGENRSWVKPAGEKPLAPKLIGMPIKIS